MKESEQRLAAANALLAERAEADRERAYPVDWDKRYAAHLSAQPAAPDNNAFDESQSPGGRCVTCWRDECQCQPAATTGAQARELAAENAANERRARAFQAGATKLQQRLAAANALLGEISESNNTGRSWRGAIRAHLSGQPAAPEPAREHCEFCRGAFPGVSCPHHDIIQPATPTDHDRAVLEAMSKAYRASLVDLAVLPEGTAYHSVGRACLAELARRESLR